MVAWVETRQLHQFSLLKDLDLRPGGETEVDTVWPSVLSSASAYSNARLRARAPGG